MSNLLYRGVNQELHAQFAGELRPKTNEPFVASATWGKSEWGNSYWGANAKNAVVEHQRNQAGFPTSGVSTTTSPERAAFYATHGGKHAKGHVYVIDRSRLKEHGVTEFVVSAIVPRPSVPQDEEVILVARDNGPIPRELVLEVRDIQT